jgi:hypothetical protein
MKRRTEALVMLLALSLVGILTALSWGQDEAGDAAQMRLWRAFYRRRATELALVETGDSATELKLVREPIQAWTNPIRGHTQHGTVHLWTNAGRPSVIGSVWSALDVNDRSRRNLCYEFHSLSQAPVSAKQGDKTWWSTKEPGIAWLPLSDGPALGSSRTIRLRQMRDLARELRAEIVAREGENGELRLLPQPLYRYPEDTAGVVDGAVFSYVLATDPELFVLLELRRDKATGKSGWMLAPARFTGEPLRLSRGEQILWESTRWEHSTYGVYDFLFGVEQQADILSE